MKHFVSCGFLIQSKDKILLCHPSNLRVGINKGDQGWGLPKGKTDKDESKLDCAIRETREETSINLDAEETGFFISFDPVYTTGYVTTFQGEQITKEVHIFYAFDPKGVLQDSPLSCPSLVEGTQIPEMDDFRWVTKEEALKICSRSLRPLFEDLETYAFFYGKAAPTES